MITQELEENINFTHADARRRGLEVVTVEHLVLVLIDNSSVRQCLTACRADVQSLRQDLEHFLESRVPHSSGHTPSPTAGFQRVLKRAISQTRNQVRGKASGAHVLAAVFAEPSSHAAYFLKKHGVERLAVLAHTSEHTERSHTAEPKLSNHDLVALAAAGKIEAPLGRADEVLELARILSRKYKNNPLLVGESGVGKTAIVHKLAHAIAARQVPEALTGLCLYSVSISDLVAGTKYRGDFEQRLCQLIEKSRAHDNAVIFIDEIHTLIGAGAVSGNSLDAANILKPALSNGVRCIGATTFAEYRRIFEKEAALARRFQKIHISEPKDNELMTILNGVKERLSTHHQVIYAPTAVKAAVRYSRRLLPTRFLPDKAIDVLDDAGARQRFAGDSTPIDDEAIAAAAAAAAGLPPRAADQGRQLQDLAQQLSAKVIDQPQAAQVLANAMLRLRLGYHDSTRIAGAFLFAGPTGVGKTEMSRQLADILGIPLLRFDMSEYMEAHAVSRLIGAPPGYVGYEQSGQLVEGISRHPNAVILLDEIEKAHPDVLNILLQVMDYGVLTDNIGRHADFSGAILVMTTNAGATQWEHPPAGFSRNDADQAGSEVLSRQLTPEFRNRLDAVVRFAPLNKTTLSRILRLRLQEISHRLLTDKKIHVTFGRRLRARLLAGGFAAAMGARPLERLICERIMEALAQAEAAGKIVSGGKYALEDQDGITAVDNRSVH